MWPGQGFYVEFFLIGALNQLQRWLRKSAFLAKTFKAFSVCNAIWEKTVFKYCDWRSCPVGLLYYYTFDTSYFFRKFRKYCPIHTVLNTRLSDLNLIFRIWWYWAYLILSSQTATLALYPLKLLWCCSSGESQTTSTAAETQNTSVIKYHIRLNFNCGLSTCSFKFNAA